MESWQPLGGRAAKGGAPTVEDVLRRLTTGLAVAGLLLAGATPAAAETYTNQFEGEGFSSFGLAWHYARAWASTKAREDGFTDPTNQCKEIYAWGDGYWAIVIWECTREV